MKDNILWAEHLFAAYSGRTVLRDVSVGVSEGEVLTLIGPNGAGKSTLLRCLAGELPPQTGAVFLRGRKLSQLPGGERAKLLAFLPTGRPNTEYMRCREIIEGGRYPHTGWSGRLEARDLTAVREAMELTGTAALSGKLFAELSDGQRQRVMLARAIAQEPAVLILDEPTSYLDIACQMELLELLKRLARHRRLAVVLSLHELGLAERISDRLLCLKAGDADRSGPPDEIFGGSYVGGLYALPEERWISAYALPEPEKKGGTARVFVISGGGSGIPVFHRLWREDIPFAAGVLQKNDLDFPSARALASALVAEEAFCPVGEEKLHEAEALLRQCERVICTVRRFGVMTAGNRRLLEIARAAGIPVEQEPETAKAFLL